jgi:ABC-2 type transport system permease protein
LKSYLALIRIDLKLALRNKSVLFFNYLFPVIFFLVFAQFMGAALGGGIAYIVSMVLILGILGNGLFGAGVRAAQEREANILRRFKVTPISPTPILVASMITGWVVFIPTIVIVMAMAHFSYGMPIPDRWLSLFGLISLGVIAFRAIGLILASVANSMQESNILVQLLYMPMLFLSGATFPVSSLPEWARVVAQFLPASYLVTGFQGVFYREESARQRSFRFGPGGNGSFGHIHFDPALSLGKRREDPLFRQALGIGRPHSFLHFGWLPGLEPRSSPKGGCPVERSPTSRSLAYTGCPNLRR